MITPTQASEMGTGEMGTGEIGTGEIGTGIMSPCFPGTVSIGGRDDDRQKEGALMGLHDHQRLTP